MSESPFVQSNSDIHAESNDSPDSHENPNRKKPVIKRLLAHFSRSHPSRSPKDSDSHSSPAEPKTYEDYLKKDEENLEEYYKEEQEKNTKENKKSKDEPSNLGEVIDNQI